jgi:phage terminase Nu1 subunit (DNA packaging protein)
LARIVNKKDLSEILGISERTLTEHQKSGLPILFDGVRGSENQYNTADVITWLIERAINGKRETSRDRLDRVRADREEIGLAKDLGELIPAAELEDAFSSKVIAVKNLLLQGDAKLKTELDALYDIDIDIELLNDNTRNILTQLSEDAGHVR